MSGPEWTPEPTDDRPEPRPLSPDPSPTRAQHPEPAPPDLPKDDEGDEALGPAPKRWRFKFSIPKFLKFRLPSLGSERHEMMPDAPDGPQPDPVGAAEPPSPEAPRPRFPRVGLKRETRVGLAALVSFVILVGALVVKKGWAGKAVPLAINANPGEEGQAPDGPKPTENEKPEAKKPEGKKPEAEPSPPRPDPPAPKAPEGEGAATPPPAAPVDIPPAQPKFADGAKADEPPPAAPTGLDPGRIASAEPVASKPLEVPADPLATAPAEQEPPIMPGDAAPPPGTASNPPEPPTAAPALPEVPPATGTPPPDLAEKPTQAPIPEPPGVPAPAESPSLLRNDPAPATAPPPAAPASTPKPEGLAPVLAEQTPKLDPVPGPGPATPSPSAAPEPAAESPRSGAGWVVIRSGGKRIPSAGAPRGAEPPVADGPRPKEEVSADQVEPVLHRVQPGENFWTISRDYYRSGRYYKALHAANGRQVPKIDELYVGTVLRIPPPEALDRRLILPATGRPKVADEPTGSKIDLTSRRDDPGGGGVLSLPTRPRRARVEPDPEAPDEPRRPTYTVKPHETLRSIARDTLNDPRRDREILDLNRDIIDDPTALAAGTTLTLPEDAVIGRRSR